MVTSPSLDIVLEFARTETPEDPHGFRFGPQSYALRTEHGGRKRVHVEWNERLLADIEALRLPNRAPGLIQRLGHMLADILEPAGWSWYARDILLARDTGRPVLLTIRSAAAEIYVLPWELLTLDSTGQCVGELPGVLIRYEWPETRTALAIEPKRRRMLVAWSAAGGSVPAADHIGAICKVAEEAGFDFDQSRDVIANASLAQIAEALDEAEERGAPVSALHLLCHGGRASEAHGLILDGGHESHEPVVVNPWQLRQVLAPYASTLRLIVVAACEGARPGEIDSVAQALHRAGIQLVVASRFPLSVTGSIEIAETLYECMLVGGEPIESAFIETRKHLCRNATHLDWASLQLYARQADGERNYPLGHAAKRSPVAREDKADVEDRSQRPETSLPSGPIDLSELSLPELLTLRTRLLHELSFRFERKMALVWVDLVGSTMHFAQFGGQAGSSQQSRCRALFERVVRDLGGRVVEVTGDGTCGCFESVKDAIKSVFAFREAVAMHNREIARDRQLIVRIGVHFGSVLANSEIVTGERIDIAARIAESAGAGEMLISEDALCCASVQMQAMCRTKGQLSDPMMAPQMLYELPWRLDFDQPISVLIEHTNEEVALPKQDIISFGRLSALADGTAANDIVLSHPDSQVHLAISRHHFELRRAEKGFVLRALSSQVTEVDGKEVAQGAEVPLRARSVVRVAYSVTLRFSGVDNTMAERALIDAEKTHPRRITTKQRASTKGERNQSQGDILSEAQPTPKPGEIEKPVVPNIHAEKHDTERDNLAVSGEISASGEINDTINEADQEHSASDSYTHLMVYLRDKSEASKADRDERVMFFEHKHRPAGKGSG